MYDEKMRIFEARLEVLDRMLMDPDVVSDNRKLREASRDHAHVSDIVDAWRKVTSLTEELEGARELLEDPEMRELAREEVSELETALADAQEALKFKLLPKDPYEGRPILLEIRAGTGGDEAALFAADLFRMYTRYGERHGLRFNLLSINTITVGASGKSVQGYKEVVASVSGEMAYNLLRFEAGVHRVQRIPATESQGRIHTSAATVAVLPEPDEVEVHIDDRELDIQVMRASGPGGQSVNTTDSAVRIVHIPTGITVRCQDEKSQLKNKQKAMRVLKARLLDRAEQEAAKEGNAARRAQVGGGDRSERIRTYNYPQNRITDHRIGLTIYKLDAIVGGALDDVTSALTAAWRAKLLQDEGLD
jgi:peptide chain release factor 1